MARVEAMSFRTAVTENISSTFKTKNISVDGSSGSFDQFVGQSKQNADTQKVSSGSEQTVSNVNPSKQYADDTKYAKVDDGALKSDNSDVSAIDEQDFVAVEAQMKHIVKDVLGIDEDTLTETMEQMGIVITDLLQPSVLQQFVLLVTGGSEATDFLTDESLLASFNQLLTQLQQFAEDNQSSILAMMEILESPVTLKEADFEGQLADVQSEDSVAEAPLEVQNAETGNEVSDAAVTVEAESAQGASTGNSVVVKASENMVQTANQADGRTNRAMGYVQESADDSESSDVMQITVTTEEETAMDSSGQESSLFSGEEKSAFTFSGHHQTESVTEPVHLMNDSAVGIQNVFTQTLDARVLGTVRMQQMIEIVNQVRDQIRSNVSETTTTLEMQLNPESLGKVYMAVSSKAGVMTATFHVQSEEAKQALESQMFQLKENLEAKNLKVESVDVQISSFDFSHSNEAERQMKDANDKNAKKKFVFDAELEDGNEEITAEEVRDQVIRDAGSSVNYIA